MTLRVVISLGLLALCVACGAKPSNIDWTKYQPPDWRKYRARDGQPSDGTQSQAYTVRHTDNGQVTFGDLKNESDRSLSRRLHGAVGQRITYIDRHRDIWRYYQSDNDPAKSINMYTHPEALGSQYGICGTEDYAITFDASGYVSDVSITDRYGIEGPIFQKTDFNWNYYYNVMCKSVPASNGLSYFPALDGETAQDMATLLVTSIDLANRPGKLPYQLTCRNNGRLCSDDIRKYLGSLRLADIDGSDLSNCPLPGDHEEVCFTILIGEGRFGPFPKSITVKGATYMHNVRVDTVSVDESFTMS